MNDTPESITMHDSPYFNWYTTATPYHLPYIDIPLIISKKGDISGGRTHAQRPAPY